MATYELTPREAKRAARHLDRRETPELSGEQLVGLHVACWLCGLPWAQAHSSACQGRQARQAPTRRLSARERAHG
jgi:hypothetical protein